MGRFAALVLAAVAFAAGGAAATAAQTYIQDGASMFSADTVASLDSRIASFNSQTGKEIVVITVPSLNGASIQDAAKQAFQQQSINGELIYISKGDRADYFLSGSNEVQSGAFTSDVLSPIRQSMESQFKTGDFDGGISNAVNSILGVYRSHLSSLQRQTGATSQYARSYPAQSRGGFHLNMFWIVILIVVGFLVLRSVFRSMQGPRSYGGPPVAGPGYGPGAGGAPGWGGGYYGGGGGGFWSGLLGGLGGAWLGNELFGGNRGFGGGYVDPNAGGNIAQTGDGGGMWGNDAGQSDPGGSSGGDWGGGGFGGGDGGGFGGGDMGGGGDSGGGW